MSEEKKEAWLNRMALATVVLAVCATLSTFKGGGYSTQSVINQAQASDQWAFYQAKSTKQHLYQLQLEQLQLQKMLVPADNPAAEAFEKRLAEYRQHVQTYETERREIEQKARALEAERDDAKRHGRPFGLAVIFLQVAILLNSIAGLMKRKQIWWAALPVGTVGVVLFADGFLSLF